MQKRFGFTADNAALRARELLQHYANKPAPDLLDRRAGEEPREEPRPSGEEPALCSEQLTPPPPRVPESPVLLHVRSLTRRAARVRRPDN